MNRRTVLGIAGASALTGLAGCLDSVREHFGLQGVIPVEITNEGDEPHNLVLEARERESGRQSYEESYTVTPNNTVSAPHLGQTEQSLRVAVVEDETEAIVRAVSVTPDVDLVTIRLYDDDLVVELERDDGENEIADGEERENATDGNGAENGTESESDANDSESESGSANESEA